MTRFWIERAPLTTDQWTQAGYQLKGDFTSGTKRYTMTIGGLAPSTQYCWRVVAGTSTSRLAYSDVICGGTAAAAGAPG